MQSQQGNYYCLHGTRHTAKEGLAAIEWAAAEHRDGSLVGLGQVCWIKLYQIAQQEGQV